MSAEDSDRSDESAGDHVESRCEQLDDEIVDLLAWLLDTETRARIYVALRHQPDSTSDELAERTGLYPSTVREALSDLYQEGTVRRQKRESAGAGNNPYEYEAVESPTLVEAIVEEMEAELNAVFNLDELLQGERTTAESADGPVRIEVDEETSDADDV